VIVTLFFPDLLFTSIALLSLFGSILLLAYLVVTETAAPRFVDSLKEVQKDFNPSVMVSIIVPARNEELSIAECLNSLVNQEYPNLEIIVVDDSSTDSTAEIAKSFEVRNHRVRLVSAGQKPRGWVGKSWPCWKGFEETGGKYLLFVDADSTLNSLTIKSSLKYVEEKGIDMFSLSPRVEMKGIVARAVLPLISGAINILYPMQKVNNEESDRAYVFGTFILVRREVYASTGGHEKVRGEIVEDAALARMTKKAGYNLRIERGAEFVATRWESDARSVYNGLERVISTSVRSYGLASILNAVLIFFITLYPILFIVIYAAIHPSSYMLLAGCVLCILNIVTSLALTSFEINNIGEESPLSALLYPLGSYLFISAIVSTSIKISRHAAINWKGQDYVETLRKAVKS
jgi:glycosyltransferase involved in cell wall biosynthesis